MNCPHCNKPTEPTGNFCEECGAPLKKALPLPENKGEEKEGCQACGAGPERIDADGFCLTCGMQQRSEDRDHVEVELSKEVAGASDRGLRHAENEDYLAAAEADGLLAAVVCDGVSSSPRSDEASMAASRAACDVLLAKLAGAPEPDYEKAMKEAVLSADSAVVAVTGAPRTSYDLPASTIVAAAVFGKAPEREAVIGWLGDSRAYFIGATQSLMLTKDHSWVNEVVDAGKMTYEHALRCRGAHVITKTLGGPLLKGESPDEPTVKRFKFPEKGWFLLCSDGLWNYADSAEALAKVVRLTPPDCDALTLARDLVKWAVKKGGQDNITVIAIAV